MNKQTQEVFEKIDVHTALLFITLLIENSSSFHGFCFSISVFPLQPYIWMWEESYLSSHT